MKNFSLAAVLALAAIAGGCGGGGGGDGSPPGPLPNPAYPAAAALANFVNGTLSCNYLVSGTVVGVPVTGSGTRTFGAPASAVFEGQVALAKSDTDAGSFIVNGVATPYAEQSTLYWTTNYQVLGVVEPGAWIVATSSASPPVSATVGDTGPLASLTVYADDTKTTVLGTIKATYVIEAGTTSNAIFDFRTEHYNAAGTYIETDDWRLRMQNDGTVSLHSISGTGVAGTVSYVCQ